MVKEMTEFNDTERLSSVRQEILRMAQSREKLLNLGRNKVIEEVAQHIEKLTGFGQDTISSFAIYIREMKK
jgi:CHASE3 domain sensor protein